MNQQMRSFFDDEGTPINSLPSLMEQPELYPGIRRFSQDPTFSKFKNYLYRRGGIWSVTLGRNQRLTRSRVSFTGRRRQSRFTPLTNHLLRLGSIGLIDRIPVLAIGSNAYPRQIHDKFSDENTDDTIPLFKGTLSNCEIVFCPYVSAKGYFPVTPRLSWGSHSIAWLMLLTPEQLQIIEKTEPNYHFVRFVSDAMRFTVESSGEQVGGCYAFWHSSWLGAAGGGLPVICSDCVYETNDSKLDTRIISSEEELLKELGNVDDLNKVLIGMARENQPPEQHVHTLKNSLETPLVNYGAALSEFPGQNVGDSFRIYRTGPIRHPSGSREPLAYLSFRTKTARRLGDWCTVVSRSQSIAEGPDSAKQSFSQATPDQLVNALPVRLIVDQSMDSDQTFEGQILLDQTVRDALGVSVGERCEVSGLYQPSFLKVSAWASSLFRPQALAARAVKQSLIIERPISWVDPALLDALGVKPGGYIIVKTAKPCSKGFKLAQIRLQAFPTPQRLTNERTLVLFPSAEARFPNPAELLGVYPDLPWIWLDEETRNALGLDKLHPCNAVLVSPSSTYLLQRLLTRFMIATLGIGAGLGALLHRILGQFFKDNTGFLGFTLADIVAVGFILFVVSAGLVVMVLDGRRASS